MFYIIISNIRDLYENLFPYNQSDHTTQQDYLQEEEEEILEFRWLKKRGIGGAKKEVQFYESFVYDGVEYSLYDCVYLYKHDEPEPYIAKLIKIWEEQPPEKVKKVKVLWFFRPIEIANYIGNEHGVVLENELFLGSGDGVGLTNINPLEAIAGKCNVLCTSKDEIQRADYVFHRTFNVNTFKISDTIDKKIAAIEDTFLYNPADCKDSSSRLDNGKAEENGKAVGSKDVVPAVSNEAANNVSKQQGTTVLRPKEVQKKLEAVLLKRCEPDGKVKDTSATAVGEKRNSKPVNGSCEADNMPSKKARVKSSNEEPQRTKISETMGNPAPEDNGLKIAEDSHVQEKVTLRVYTKRVGKKCKLSNGELSKPAVSLA